MKKKSLTALFAILASIFFCFTTVQAGDDGSWQKVNSYDEIIGEWECTKTIAIPEDEDMPETSLGVFFFIECIKQGHKQASVTLNIKLDFEKFLTDLLNSDPMMKTLGVQEDGFWEVLLQLGVAASAQPEKEMTITTGKYYVNMAKTDSGRTNIDNLWINADKSQIKIIFDEPLSFDLGDEGIKEIILDRK